MSFGRKLLSGLAGVGMLLAVRALALPGSLTSIVTWVRATNSLSSLVIAVAIFSLGATALLIAPRLAMKNQQKSDAV